MGGIIEHARHRGGWRLALSADPISDVAGWLREWDGDGALVLVQRPEEQAALATLPFPVVNLSGHMGDLTMPTVMVDHQAIGRLAAEHLWERGFTRFGYYGQDERWFSLERYRGFAAAIAARGWRCERFVAPPELIGAAGWNAEQRALEAWLRTLRMPVGILASNDALASILMDACYRLGWQVPEDVAVVGVDNAVLTCESCLPTITSVSRSDHAVGRAAAALLEALMHGAAPPPGPILIPPDGVVVRQSSDTHAIEDPQVSLAVRWIRSRIAQSLTVTDLMGILGRSRRRVEGLFQEVLGESPYQTICRLRIEHAKRLLTLAPGQPLATVAAACGIPDVRRLRLVFTRVAGCSPRRFVAELTARQSPSA